MKFSKTKIPGLIVCEPTRINDFRGFFNEYFRQDLLENFIGYKINFCQDNLSNSKYGVLRGLHFQIEPFAQSKLVSVLEGEILDVVVDLRLNSKYYGKSYKIKLNDINCQQLFIPKGFAHGFLVLSDSAKVLYKVDNYYNKKYERGLNHDDPMLGIDWGMDKKSIFLSEKDKNYPPFNSHCFFDYK